MSWDVAMEQALTLAVADGSVRGTNPRVGCVIVKDGAIVGTGTHLGSGTDHAEVMALREAGGAALGATAVVTLEPCSHTGRTGPCTQALIAAGIVEVVYAMADPTVEASGGHGELQAAGISVIGGVLNDRAQIINADWTFMKRYGRPFVIGKIAMSLDGRVDGVGEHRLQLTGRQAQQWAHELRAEVDAVAVGSGTISRDNPSLSVRDVFGASQPLRIALGGNEVPSEAAIRRDAELFVQVTQAQPEQALRQLCEMGVQRILIEGGPRLLSSYLSAGFVDRMHWLIAPIFIGRGPMAPSASTLLEHLEMPRVSLLGEDVLISAELAGREVSTTA